MLRILCHVKIIIALLSSPNLVLPFNRVLRAFMGFEASIVIDIKIINNHLVDEDNKILA